MTDQQLNKLRYIIQEEIAFAINTEELGYPSSWEEEQLEKMWQKFKDSFNGLN